MKINHFAFCRSVSEAVFCARWQAGYRLPTDVIDKAAKAGARYHRSGDIDGMKDAIKQVFLEYEIRHEDGLSDRELGSLAARNLAGIRIPSV